MSLWTLTKAQARLRKCEKVHAANAVFDTLCKKAIDVKEENTMHGKSLLNLKVSGDGS